MQICPVGTYRQRGWWLWACSLHYLHCALVFCWSTVTCHFRLLINYSGCCTSSSTSFSFPSSLPCSSSSALFFWLFYLVWLCLTHYAALNSWSSSCLSLLSAVMTGMNCHTCSSLLTLLFDWSGFPVPQGHRSSPSYWHWVFFYATQFWKFIFPFTLGKTPPSLN